MDTYTTIRSEAHIEFIEKKSVFMGHAFPVSDEESCLLYIDELRSRYADATHNVYAYVLRQNNVGIPFTKDNESHWQAFGYCYAKDNDLSDLEALSFARLISNYISPKDTVPAKNKYIKENLIEE